MPTTSPRPPAPTRHPGAGPRLSADERRASVIEAAVTAFASGGLAGTPTDEIARLAGVSQPYLFRLFGSKQELFMAAVGRAFERITLTFEEASRRPEAGLPEPQAHLVAMGRAYGNLLADHSLLRLQLHAFAACDDPVVRAFVRQRFAQLVARVAELGQVPADSLREFFAQGMFLNVAAAMDLDEADLAWRAICDPEMHGRSGGHA